MARLPRRLSRRWVSTESGDFVFLTTDGRCLSAARWRGDALRAHLVLSSCGAALNIVTSKAVTRLQFLSPATFPRNTVIEAFGRLNVVGEPPTTVVATGGCS